MALFALLLDRASESEEARARRLASDRAHRRQRIASEKQQKPYEQLAVKLRLHVGSC